MEEMEMTEDEAKEMTENEAVPRASSTLASARSRYRLGHVMALPLVENYHRGHCDGYDPST